MCLLRGTCWVFTNNSCWVILSNSQCRAWRRLSSSHCSTSSHGRTYIIRSAILLHNKPSDSRCSLLFALMSDRYLSSLCVYDSTCRLQQIFPGASVACFAMTSLILAASTVICACRLPGVITLNSVFKLHIFPTFIQGDSWILIVCFLLGNSPASDLYMPTFRNTLSVPSS